MKAPSFPVTSRTVFNSTSCKNEAGITQMQAHELIAVLGAHSLTSLIREGAVSKTQTIFRGKRHMT
jgi:hypothetical protein